jgi:hypothetical protein
VFTGQSLGIGIRDNHGCSRLAPVRQCNAGHLTIVQQQALDSGSGVNLNARLDGSLGHCCRYHAHAALYKR